MICQGTVRIAVLALSLGLLTPLPAAAAGDETPATKDPIIATVNGTHIFMSDVANAHRSLPERYRSIPLQAVYPMLLTGLIDAKLVAKEARSAGLHEEDAIKRRLTRSEEQILEQEFMIRHVRDKITETMLRARYDEMIKEFNGQEEAHARHILVDSETKAREIIGQLEKGADFAALARERSTGPSGPGGGDLGYFKEADMVPAFAKAAFALSAGEFTRKPVQTQFGWHVIKLEDRRQAPPPDFEESSNKLSAELAREISTTYLEGLRKGAAIERFNPDGTPATQGLKAQ